MIIEIQPKVITIGSFPDTPKQYTIRAFDVDITHVHLKKDATINIRFMETADMYSFCPSGTAFTLTQEEYDGWGDDDDYIIDLICTKYGLTKAS